MDYQKYNDLGFKRTDLHDVVEFKQTGFYGFALEKKVNKKQMVCASSGGLDRPNLYIKKRNSDTYHIIPISAEAVIDLFEKSGSVSYSSSVA